MTDKITSDAPCMECGMSCSPQEYHPYAACLMFKGCLSGSTVRENLRSVIEHSQGLASPPAGWVMVPVEANQGIRGVLYRTKSGIGDDYMLPEGAQRLWSELLAEAK